MNIGLNRERSLGLEVLGEKILTAYERDLALQLDATKLLNEHLGVRPITDLQTACILAEPIKASAAFHISSRIHQDLMEDHAKLAENPAVTESAFTFNLEGYQPNEETGLVFGRYPKILREALSNGVKIGQDRVLEALSPEGVPLANIVNLSRREAVHYPHEIRGNFFGHLYLTRTAVVGVYLGIAYRGDQAEFKVFYQDQLHALRSLQN